MYKQYSLQTMGTGLLFWVLFIQTGCWMRAATNVRSLEQQERRRQEYLADRARAGESRIRRRERLSQSIVIINYCRSSNAFSIAQEDSRTNRHPTISLYRSRRVSFPERGALSVSLLDRQRMRRLDTLHVEKNAHIVIVTRQCRLLLGPHHRTRSGRRWLLHAHDKRSRARGQRAGRSFSHRSRRRQRRSPSRSFGRSRSSFRNSGSSTFSIHNQCPRTVRLVLGSLETTLSFNTIASYPFGSGGRQTVWLLSKKGERLSSISVGRRVKRVIVNRHCSGFFTR